MTYEPEKRLDDYLSRLQKVKKVGKEYVALCPAHDDHNPSLRLSQWEDGTPRAWCGAGCSQDAIFAAIGLDRPHVKQIPTPTGRRIEAIYDYRNEQGDLLRQKVRYQPKNFIIRHPNGEGWVWNQGDAPPVLYHLPELLQAKAKGDTVFIVEGEKDADRLNALGLTATTTIDGAAADNQRSKWRTDYTEQLAGSHHVVILPDNDGPGKAHAAAIVKGLNGHIANIQVLNLPGLPAKGDVSDWLDAGHTKEELLALVTPVPAKRKTLLTVDEVLNRRMAHDWLIKNLLERKQLGVIYGESQSYKSLLAIELACSVAMAMDWRGRITKGGAVLYIAGEGGGGGLTRRLRAWEIANHSSLAGSPLIFREVQTILPMDTHDVIEEVSTFLQARGWKLELVILDTLARTLQGNENSQEDFARYQQALDTIRDHFDCASLFLHHTGHMEKDRPRGAYSIMGNADVLLQMEKLDDKLSKLVVRKMKDAESQEDMVFKLAVVELGGVDEDGNPITSVVLRHLQDFQPTPRPLKGYEEIAYNLIKQQGSLLIGDWRKAFFDAVKATNPELAYNTLKQAWRRAERALIEKRLVVESGVTASLTQDGIPPTQEGTF